MEFKFGTMSIYELGQFISDKLHDDGVKEQAVLTVYVNNEEFKKVDEDLYYRTKNDESQEFIPSEGEIDINFELVKILVKEK
jgi:hypothetical protein